VRSYANSHLRCDYCPFVRDFEKGCTSRTLCAYRLATNLRIRCLWLVNRIEQRFAASRVRMSTPLA